MQEMGAHNPSFRPNSMRVSTRAVSLGFQPMLSRDRLPLSAPISKTYRTLSPDKRYELDGAAPRHRV